MDAEQDRLDKLRLIRSSQIGPVSYHQLIRRFGSARAALDAIPDLVGRAGGKLPRLASSAEALKEFEQVQIFGARHVFCGEQEYPPLLAEIDTAPPVLIVRGELALAQRPCLAMVGARNASAAACRFALDLSADLSARGIVIVSGLARGIDAHAHRGALVGGTIAVIASGIHIAYPPEHDEFQEEIARKGLLISEQPPGREPLARHFPARNRIIAGVARGTVVVEAAPKSGSLITARIANEAGRDVMAVPGSPRDPRAQGCNLLIREGATLVQSSDDILEVLQGFGHRSSQICPRFREEPEIAEPDDETRMQLRQLLSPVPVGVDDLVRQSGLATPLVQTILLELELGGLVERHAGGRVSLY